MATNTFKNYLTAGIGTTATTVYNPTAVGLQATVIGMSVANVTSSAITVDVYLVSGVTTAYIVKGATVMPGGALIAVGGDQKLVVEKDDLLKVQASTAASADVILSVLEIT